MKLTFLGGADEVGASGLLVEMGGRRLLVDCGIRPSPKARWGLAGDQLPDLSLIERSGGLDAILVTHAHTDHTGALELVVERYPDIPVYATPATLALTRVLHADARRIMQSRLDEEGELPLFDDVAVERLLERFIPAPFHTSLALGDNLTVTFFPAGHIAGAAMLGLSSPEGRLLVSGDISISPQRTVEGARPPAFVPDVVIVESTYGGRLHANRAVQERRLAQTVAEVVAAGGKVLIPAFALGRAQEILLALSEFRQRGELPAVPVWADGMVRAICTAYASFPDVLPLALRERGAAFFDDHTRAVQSSEQRNVLTWGPGPAVIVASSGMLAGGPSQSYARALASSPQHAILLTGYQDEESPGRRLQELAERGHGTLLLGKEKVDVQCRLGTYSLSAHADEAQLISLVETLDAPHVILVHGDEGARASLAAALERRKRIVHQPCAGQTLEFHFERQPLAAVKGRGAERLDFAALWKEVSGPSGGVYTLEELGRVWWGELAAENRAALQKGLARADLYFIPDPVQADTYRARSPQQVELARQRRQQMQALASLPGQWVLLRGPAGNQRLVRCTGVAAEYFTAEEGDEIQSVWPEDLIAPLGTERPPESTLKAYGLNAEPAQPVKMEPNQALAQASAHFPPAAHLRKAGYRLDQHILVLTFDFPDAARQQYAAEIESLAALTGWQVELTPEANQNALTALARQVLPAEWQIVKGPAIHRDQKRVAITLAGEPPASTADIRLRFAAESGYELILNFAAQPTATVTEPPLGGEQMEINAAYALIKAALDGSSLYRTSLKGGEIVLAFISPQVGERYRPQIERLSQQVGWRLSISPQANQGAILQLATALLPQAGWTVIKGPGVYPERAEVTVTVAGFPDEAEIQEIAASFEQQTGFHLIISGQPQAASGQPSPAPTQDGGIEIPLALIRLRLSQQATALDPEKLRKAVERIQRLGQVSPPIQVRRVRDGYLLLDGLYRLKAAASLGMERILARVE